MTTTEGDELLAMIRQYVHGRVPAAHEEAIVEVVAKVVVAIMSEPRFYTQLRVVQDLRIRLAQAERAIAMYQQKTQRPTPAAPKPRKSVPKKAVKKTSKKPPLPHNVKAFKRGAAGY